MDRETKISSFDKDTIDTREYYELEHWAKEFKVSIEALKTAIKKVGNSVEMVKKYIKK